MLNEKIFFFIWKFTLSTDAIEYEFSKIHES